MRVFLRLDNYYRKFIEGYSKIVSPLTGLFKKEKAWNCIERRKSMFGELKHRIVTAPVLKLPDFDQSVEVHTKQSNFSIGGFLMQEGNSFSFESRNLEDRKRRYLIHEKEMIAVVHCLHTWRHYLFGKSFFVKIDNVVISYFMT